MRRTIVTLALMALFAIVVTACGSSPTLPPSITGADATPGTAPTAGTESGGAATAGDPAQSAFLMEFGNDAHQLDIGTNMTLTTPAGERLIALTGVTRGELPVISSGSEDVTVVERSGADLLPWEARNSLRGATVMVGGQPVAIAVYHFDGDIQAPTPENPNPALIGVTLYLHSGVTADR